MAAERPLARLLLTPVRAARRQVALGLGLGIVTALSTVGLAASAAWLIVRAAQRPPVLSMAVVMGFVQLFALSKAVTRYLERLSIHDAALGVLGTLRVAVFEAIERLVPGRLGATADAEITSTAIDDVDRLEHLYVAVMPPLVVAVVTAVVAVIIAGVMIPAAALVLLVAALAEGLALPLLAHRLSRQPTAELERGRAARRALVDTVVASGAELATSPALAALFDELDEIERRIAWNQLRLARRRGALVAASMLITGCSVLVLAALSAARLASGQLGLDALAVLPLLALAVFEILGGLAPAIAELPEDLGAATRLSQLLETPALWPEPGQLTPLPAAPHELCLTHLDVGYGAPLLEDVTLELTAPAHLGLVGKSGSGKTTLLNVLARFVPPLAGDLTLGAVSYHQLAGSQVRAVLGTADQEPHLFNTTLADNLRLAKPDATEIELLDAVRVVGLAELVELDPAGMGLLVGEGGARLSGGERQRVGLARLVLAAPELLVLDEPTEGLDEELARDVMGRLRARFGGSGVIVVTHRARDLQGLDAVYAIESGKLDPVVASAR